MSYYLLNPFTAVDVQGTVADMDAQASAVFATSGVFGNALRSIGAASGTLVGASTATGVVTFSSQSTMIAVGVSADVQAGAMGFDGTGVASFVGDSTDFETAVLSSAGAGTMSLIAESRAAAAFDIDTSGAATFTSLETFLLNHWNGTDTAAATTSLDEILGAWAQYSGSFNALLTTDFSKFGSASLEMTAQGGESVGVTSPAMTIDRTGNWTIEGFLRVGAASTCSIWIADSSLSNIYAQIDIDTSTGYSFVVYDSGFSSLLSVSGGSVSASTFYHAAITHNSATDTYEAFFNGSRVASSSSASDIGALSRMQIFVQAADGNTAWADEVRVTSGVLYSGTTYTVPTAEFS